MTDLPTVAHSTPDEARRRADRIRSKGQDLYQEIVTAYQGRDWDALGYDSWDEYLTGEFRNAPLALPREERPSQIASLREQGLSIRAIAAATGTATNTVMNDLKKVSQIETPDPKPIQGIDGKTYTPKSDPFDALTADYPEARQLPKRSRSEAVAGHQALANLPEPERPRREEIFTKWIRAEIERGEQAPESHTLKAAELAEEAALALAKVGVVANRLADYSEHFHGIEADWPDLLGSSRTAIDLIESIVTPTTGLRRIK